MPADLAVIGLGPYGLPLAQAAVAAGIPTLGYRTGPEADPLTPAEVRRMLATGFRTPAGPAGPAELGRVRTAVICAPTPPSPGGGLDLGQVEAAARTLAAHMRPHTTVILESPVTARDDGVSCARCWSRAPGCAPAATSTSPTPPAAWTPATATSPTPTPRRSSAASPPPAPSRPPPSTAASPTRWSGPGDRARPRRCSSWRPTSGTSTSPWSTRWPCSATTSASTCGTSSAAPRPSPSASRPSAPAPASAATASRSTRAASRTAAARPATRLRMVALAQQVNARMPRYVVQRGAALLNEHGKSVARRPRSCSSASPTSRTAPTSRPRARRARSPPA
ncbi:Nucleotide sugar dehydrogenase OS=Streptomyces tendae OX=1932 GN=GUR47_16880 PE=3 SV=1 [Streptomyces tendae]